MKKIFLCCLLFIFVGSVKAQTLEEKLNSLSEKTDILLNEVNDVNSLDRQYPIGSIYISTLPTNPQTLFGGTWIEYSEGRKIVGSGQDKESNYIFDTSGGVENVTLTVNNLPAHSHTLTPTGSVSSSFTGKAVTSSSSGAHSHKIGWWLSSSEAKGYRLYKSAAFKDRVLVNQGSTLTTTKYITSSSAGSHSHALTASGTVTSTFTGKSVNTSSVGSGTSFSVQNPYVTVYMWKRLS